MNQNKKNEVSLAIAIIPVIFLLVLLVITLVVFELGEAHIALFLSAMFTAALAVVVLKTPWKVIEDGMIDSIKMSMQAIIIMLIIGMVVGTWILSGIVPTMIFYGLKILSPGIFLVATVLICSVVSLATGSSWTTAATVGIALVGVGAGLGIPIEIVVGAIISGSYFGDKISPLSDTTNLAPAMAGSDLFEHIRHMLYTTVPSYVISLVLFAIIGMKYAGKTLDQSSIDVILNGLDGSFNLSPFLLIAPALVIFIVIKKIPAVPGLFGAALLGGIFAMIFQGASLGTVMDVANNGYSSSIGVDAIDSLLSRGGMQGMLWTVSLILCAMMYGGAMEKSGMLNAIARSILSLAKNTGGLITATVLTSIGMNIIAADQYLAIVIPGRMYADAYKERKLHPKNLSRTLEDAGTLTSPLIPWNTCGAYMISTLGVAPWVYVPYCFLNLINPVVAIIYGYTGFSIEYIDDEEELLEA
jgi:NhaC family Na+:H+ antiporter